MGNKDKNVTEYKEEHKIEFKHINDAKANPIATWLARILQGFRGKPAPILKPCPPNADLLIQPPIILHFVDPLKQSNVKELPMRVSLKDNKRANNLPPNNNSYACDPKPIYAGVAQ